MPDLIDTIVQDAVAAQNNTDKGSAFQKIHDEITELQRQGGGANGAQFQESLRTLNQKLHENGILSNMEIRGIEEGDPPSDKLFQKRDRIILSDGMTKGDLVKDDVLAGSRWFPDDKLSPTQTNILNQSKSVYAHGLTMDPANPGHKHEAWTESDISNWYNFDYDAGIVVLRAPDAD